MSNAPTQPLGYNAAYSADSWINKSGGVLGVGSGNYGTYGYQIMMASGVVAGLGDIAAGQNQAAALQTEAGFNKFQAQENLKRAGTEVAQLNLQTQTEIQQSGSKANQIIGQQRAAYSSQGVNVNAGTAATEQATEGQMSAVDTQTLLNTAALKAWGIETQATQTAGQETLEGMGEQAQGAQSVLIGGAQAMNQLLSEQEEAERTRLYGGGRN